MNNPVGTRAVVLGGSMAGLLAARVLAESYETVTVVDRDRLTGVRTARRGVPQGPHAHGLLAKGQEILEDLFPGLTEELTEDDVPLGDLNGDIRWYFSGQRVASQHSDLACVSITRPVLEAHVRRRLQDLPNVTFMEETGILGLLTDDARSTITGVSVSPGDDPDAPIDLPADLVVDATGRGSRTPAWLAEFGYSRPVEEKVKVGLAYTTRYFRLKRDVFHGDLSINPVATPDSPRGAIFSRISERDPMRAELSLTGMLGDHPPTDSEGFEEFVKSLPAPEIHAAIKDAEPLSDAVTFRFPASVRRRYERLRHFPDRLLVLGDAVCSFNPVYGQGMTVAALEAMILREHLGRGVPKARRFFKAVSKVVDVAWDIAAGGDLAHPEVEGKRTLKVKLGNAYNGAVIGAAMNDSTITDLFFRVACFMEPPSAMMKPGVLRRVLFPKRAPAAEVVALREGADEQGGPSSRDRAA